MDEAEQIELELKLLMIIEDVYAILEDIDFFSKDAPTDRLVAYKELQQFGASDAHELCIGLKRAKEALGDAHDCWRFHRL